MNFFCLILILSLAFMWTAVTGCIRNGNCKEDECCKGGGVQGVCTKLGSEGSSCTLRKHHVYLTGDCPCLPDLICDPVDEKLSRAFPKILTNGICKKPKDVSSTA
ncbi:U9-ctenitoxin-Pr1a-like [Parasteatoda tepidariorum]|uniref:U9-ctenitoxin-Pr1a-like n=1 Tax=Parasteatoda tepidariorum TaxID=114398 RepID=UPI0039BD30D8